MRKVRALLLKMAGFFLGPRKDEGFSAELATHLQMHADENVHSGMSPQEARRITRCCGRALPSQWAA